MSLNHRQNLKSWVMEAWGDGETVMCACCLTEMTVFELTLDRFPVPGKFGGTYTRQNIRPMCVDCNSGHMMEPTLEFVTEYMLRMHDVEFVPSSPPMSPARLARKQQRQRERWAIRQGYTVGETEPLRHTIGDL